jgi:hypothetical protein
MILKQPRKVLWYVLFAFTIAMLLNKLLLVITFRYEIAGLEPYFSFLVLKVGSGQLFTNPEQYPFIVTQYSPLYFYLVHSFAFVLEQLGVNEVRAVYVVGRLVNLLCNLGTSFFVFQFLKQHLKASFWQASALAMIIFNLFINHNIGVRPDSLKILFLTLMFIQTYLFLQNKLQKHLILLALFGILAMLSKQDALIPVLIALFILFSHKHFFNSVSIGLAMGVITGFLMLALCNWQIELVILNLVGGISQGANPVWFWEIVRLNYLTFSIQIIFLFALIFWLLKTRKNLVFVLSILILFTAALLALFKWGSNFNYFIDFQIISLTLLFIIAFLKGERWLQWLLVIGCVGIYFNNFQNKNIRMPDLWVERDAYYIFQKDIKIAKEIQQQFLHENQSIICFSLKYALFLNEFAIQWAMVNDYPEVFLNKLEALTNQLPIQVFDYHYNCEIEEMQDAIFMAPTNRNEWYVDKLNAVFGMEDSAQQPFHLQLLGTYQEFTFHQILCNE